MPLLPGPHRSHGGAPGNRSGEDRRGVGVRDLRPLHRRRAATLRLAFHSGVNAVTAADFAACREHFNEQEIVLIVAVCAMFGYLNRWNNTMATALEDEPAAFADATLAPLGWDAEKYR